MRSRLPIIVLILAAVFWGIAIPAFKAAVHIPPFSYAFLRFWLAFLVLAPFYLLSSKHQNLKIADLPLLAVTALTGVTINIGFLFIGLSKTSAVEATIISDLTPLLAIFAAWFFLHEPLKRRDIIGTAMAMIGMVVVVGSSVFQTNVGIQHLLGNLFIVVSTISWVIFNILSKKLFDRYSAVTITTYLFLFGCLTFAPLATWEFARQPHWIYSLTTVDIISVSYYAVFGSILAYFFYEWGLSKVSTAKAVETQHITPVVSIVIAILFLHERPTITFAIGALLIFFGVVYATRKGVRGKE